MTTEGVWQKKVRGGTRSALLEAAAGLLEGYGIEAVTLRAVGEQAGVSRQAPYRHFADKGALLSVLAAGYFKVLSKRMVEAADTAGYDPLQRLEAMTKEYVRFALENPSRYRMMFGLKARGETRQELHEAAHALHERFVGAVAECQEAGKLPVGDPVELSALLYATAHGAIDLTLSGHDEQEKGLGDPVKLVRVLLARLRRDRSQGSCLFCGEVG